MENPIEALGEGITIMGDKEEKEVSKILKEPSPLPENAYAANLKKFVRNLFVGVFIFQLIMATAGKILPDDSSLSIFAYFLQIPPYITGLLLFSAFGLKSVILTCSTDFIPTCESSILGYLLVMTIWAGFLFILYKIISAILTLITT